MVGTRPTARFRPPLLYPIFVFLIHVLLDSQHPTWVIMG
jgi:hypothetical protein